MKNVIIFGATGGTGAYLTDWCTENLDSDKFKVIATGRRKTDFFSRRGIEYICVDILNENDFLMLPQENVHAVIFLAGILPASMSGYHPKEYLMCNIIGAFNVFEYARKVGADRLLYSQTIREIGNFIGKGDPLTPSLKRSYPLADDHTVYTISKNTAVDLLEHYYAMYGLKRFIFRFPTIYTYSPVDYYYVNGEKKIKAYRYMIELAKRGEPIEMWGDPERAHDVVYVKDMCQMLCKAVCADCEGGTYHVGTGSPISLKQQIEGMIEVFSAKDRKSIIIPRPDKPSARSYTLDISNAKRDLGYEPAYGYIEYLEDFKREMEINRYKELR